jgi:hypothetical protein
MHHDCAADEGMDLLGYVEFQRAYRWGCAVQCTILLQLSTPAAFVQQQQAFGQQQQQVFGQQQKFVYPAGYFTNGASAVLSCRGCVKAHRLALLAQRQLWQSVLHDTVACKDLQAAAAHMEKTSHQANALYKRVLERWVLAILAAYCTAAQPYDARRLQRQCVASAHSARACRWQICHLLPVAVSLHLPAVWMWFD